jgi:hypothetical protein
MLEQLLEFHARWQLATARGPTIALLSITPKGNGRIVSEDLLVPFTMWRIFIAL